MAERTRANRGDAPDLEQLFTGHRWLSAWDSPEAFGRYVKGLDPKRAWHDGGWEKSSDRGEWAGTPDMDSALHLAAGNWKQGRELVDKVTSAVKLAYPVRKEPVKYNVVGSVPSVPRAVAGDPKNMIEPVLNRSKRRLTITLVSDMSANWTVNSQNFVSRAAVLAALVDNIETMGYSCEVVAVAHTMSWGTKDTACTAVKIKESHQPLDMARAAFGLGHPSMFRRMIFADWGGNEENRHLGRGLGHCSRMELTTEQNEKHIYYIPNLEGRTQYFFADEATAIQHGLHLFVEALVIQGCPAFKKDEDKFKYFYRQTKDDGKTLYWAQKTLKEVTTGKKSDDWDDE